MIGYKNIEGISIYEPWLNFEIFLKDMDLKPNSSYTIEGINNDGNYEPSNCRWATRYEQAHNRTRAVILTK